MNRPYIIRTPSWSCGRYGGILAMNTLCHVLNEMGENCYLVIERGNTFVPNLNIKIATPEVLKEAIVIYPEIYPGNPLNSPRVVRWLLGFHVNHCPLKKEELYFVWQEFYRSKLCYGGLPVLWVNTIDRKVFYNDPNTKRSGSILWVHKGNLVPRIPETSGVQEIGFSWPSSKMELANLLRRTEILYSYDDNSSLILEAKLCGCPVVIIGNASGIDLKKECGEVYSKGITTSKDGLDKAKEELKDFGEFYDSYSLEKLKCIPEFLRVSKERYP